MLFELFFVALFAHIYIVNMAKIKTHFVCQNCGTTSPKWAGKCNACGEWNTFVEEVQVSKNTANPASARLSSASKKPVQIGKIQMQNTQRVSTSDPEFDRVLGGGMVPGALILLGGEPGIGKSTLALQMALQLNNKKILYVSGEESEQQIKLRAQRLATLSENCYIYSETSLENILAQVHAMQPDVVVVDSIQTTFTNRIEASPGSISQIRECSNMILKEAKTNHIPFILIGHINKDGNIAGPKVLEHVVDTVLQFEGDRNHVYRILRAQKNRFGSTSELGIFEMKNSGLSAVENPSEMLLSQHNPELSGTAIAATIDGIRPFLIEVQALVSTAAYGTPQRSSIGFDLRRLNMLLAVLEKRAGFRLSIKDVFLNLAGGIRVDDPAVDLAVICAILSSDQDIVIPASVAFAGEVGLTGEIRQVNRIDARIDEAQRLGFETIYVSAYNKKGLNLAGKNIKVVFVTKVEEIFTYLFG